MWKNEGNINGSTKKSGIFLQHYRANKKNYLATTIKIKIKTEAFRSTDRINKNKKAERTDYFERLAF